MAQPESYNLPPVKRHITGLNSDDQAVFLDDIDDNFPIVKLPQVPINNTSESARVGVGYIVNEVPIQLNDKKDFNAYASFLVSPPTRIALPNGVIFRVLEFPPGATLPLHYTPSLDIGVVIEGSLIAGLDSGETRLLKRGDSLIQRSTNHEWKNPSLTEWARVAFILVGAQGGVPEHLQQARS